MANLQALYEQFLTLYGESHKGITVFHAPGRVNLIGEHTDYNGGYVFPAALTFGTHLLIRRREDRQIGLATTNFELKKLLSMDDLSYRKEDDWMNYPKGIIVQLDQTGRTIQYGYDMLFHGEIPNGSGLSSSASIEVVTAYALLLMEGLAIDFTDISLLAQKSENEYNGVQCGIMDQFAVANGKKEHAILLMCDTLEYKHVPFRSKTYKLVIGNTCKRRGLVDSAYNERRNQCEQAVQELKRQFPDLTLLGQLSLGQYREYEHLIQDETARRRARHVMEEIDRVLQSMEVLEQDNLEAFGKLMTESHESLRDQYEVTGKELDIMVSRALEVSGVLGSRMTGAGFGGCTVSLVHEDGVERFKEYVGSHYRQETGIEPEFYVCEIGDGVKQVKEAD